MPTIPDSVKKKIEEEAVKRFPYPEITKSNGGYVATRTKAEKDNERIVYCGAAYFGYSLATERIAELEKQLEKLREALELIEQNSRNPHSIETLDGLDNRMVKINSIASNALNNQNAKP